MTILAFDTATAATAVALVTDASASEVRDDPAPGERPGHATRLLPLADELLSAANLDWDDLDLLAVGTGPGGFTGLRVGVASARGIAMGLGIMLAGRSSLAALARAALVETGAPRALALIDARRGEVYAQEFTWIDERPHAVAGVRALAPHDVPAPPDGSVVIGDGVTRYCDALALDNALVPAQDSPLHRVQAIQLAALATYGMLPGQVGPEYVRAPDAKEPGR